MGRWDTRLKRNHARHAAHHNCSSHRSEQNQQRAPSQAVGATPPPPHQRLALCISTACACELPALFSASRRSIISLGGMKHRNILRSADRAGCGGRRTIDRLLHPAKCLAGEWRGVHMQEQRSACRRARRQHPPRCPRASARAVVTYQKVTSAQRHTGRHF